MSAPSSTQPAVWFPAIRTRSGTDVFTERLAAGLQQRGIRTEISWLPHRAEFAPWTVTKPKQPDWANIVHINTWLPPRFLPPDLPIVANLHSSIHDPVLAPHKKRLQALYHTFWIRQIETIALRRAHSIVAVSHYTARQAQTTFGCQDIAVIANAIDLAGPFHPIAREAPHRPFRLLYVGNWSPLKGVDLLAPIMNMLGENFELHYTTDRQQRHTLYPLPTNSRCLGRFNEAHELAACYQNADALLFPSRLEGFGLVALEAQACGLPVIATRGSALPEVIADGITGLLCPQNDAHGFTEAVRKLAGNSILWQQMRQNARKHVENQFSLDAMIDHYLGLYRTTLVTGISKSP